MGAWVTGAAMAWGVIFVSAFVAMALCVDWKAAPRG